MVYVDEVGPGAAGLTQTQNPVMVAALAGLIQVSPVMVLRLWFGGLFSGWVVTVVIRAWGCFVFKLCVCQPGDSESAARTRK